MSISKDFQEEVWGKLNSIERRLIALSGGSFAPINAEFVVMSLNATLSDERRLQASEGISLTDGGAGGDADLTLDVDGLAEDSAVASGDFFLYYDTVAGDHKKIDLDDMPGGGAPVGAEYVVVSLSGVLTDERRLQGGEAILLTDGGAGGDLTVDLDINPLAEQTGESGDFFVYYDTTAGDHKKIDWDDMPGGGGGGDVTAGANLTDDYVTRGDGGAKGIQTSLLYLTDAGKLLLNETINTDMTIGLTINQGTADNEIISLKSSEVDHGCTNNAETDTYASLAKMQGSTGGLMVRGFKDGANGYQAFVLQTFNGATWNTTKSTAGLAAMEFCGYTISGTGGGGTPTANGNLVAMKVYDGAFLRTRWILDVEGDVWMDGGIDSHGAFTCEDSITITTPDTFSITNDGSDSIIQWSDGYLKLLTSTFNANSILEIKGNGTGEGWFYLYDEDEAEYTLIRTSAGKTYLINDGTTPTGMIFEVDSITKMSLTTGDGLSIYSDAGSDEVRIHHDDSDAWIQWDDGVLKFLTIEAVASQSSILEIYGKGVAGRGQLRVYEDDDVNYVELDHASNYAQISSKGTGATGIKGIIGVTTHLTLTTTQLSIVGKINATAGFSDNGTDGVDGSFTDHDSNSVTVSGGIITALT